MKLKVIDFLIYSHLFSTHRKCNVECRAVVQVLTWLAKHNFPHGLVSFVDGITTDPLGHKATFIKSLQQVKL